MKLVVANEGQFLAYGDDIYYYHMWYEDFWQRYLEVFDSVVVAARVKRVDSVPPNFRKSSGPKVTFCRLPAYHGPREYWRCRRQLRAALRQGIAGAEAFILRVSGTIGTQVWKQLPPGAPFGVEVVGDPWNSLSPGGARSIGRPIFRRMAVRELRRQCQQAVAALYVTQHNLQDRYPPNADAYAVGCSDVQLSNDLICADPSERLAAIAAIPKRLAGEGPPVRLGWIGSFTQAHKLADIHIRALAQCVLQGHNVTLEMIGDGKLMEAMRALAHELGVGERVVFRGRLPGGKPIFDAIDAFDVFVNASAAEGLPRVVIEALARGCPCVASDIGGTSELLESRHLVRAGDVDGLAQTILRVLDDPKGMAAAVERNLGVARNYTSEVLDTRRRVFYEELRKRTEAVLARRA